MPLLGEDKEEDVRLLLAASVLVLDPTAFIRHVNVDAARDMAVGFSGNVPSMLATVEGLVTKDMWGGLGFDYLESAKMLGVLANLTPSSLWSQRTHPKTFPEMERRLSHNRTVKVRGYPDRPTFLGTSRPDGLCAIGDFGMGFESTHVIKGPENIFYTSFWVDRMTGLPPRTFMEWCVESQSREGAHEMNGGPWSGRTIEEEQFLTRELNKGRVFGLYEGYRSCRAAYTLSSFRWNWKGSGDLIPYC